MGNKNYTDIPSLAFFVLEESAVLDVVITPGIIEFDIELVFAKDHPELLPARKGEWAYSRRGTIRFTSADSISWAGVGQPGIDVNGERDYGSIDSFTIDGDRYELEGGDWGGLSFTADGVIVNFTQAP